MALVFTMSAAIIAFKLSGFEKSLHSISGIITGALGIIICFGGFSALMTRKVVNMDW
jgi:hypothetical protein